MHLSSAVTQSSGCFLTLNHMDGLFAHQFHGFYFFCAFSLHEAHDASKMKLVTLAGRRLTVDPGQVELGSKKYSCMCVCVCFVISLHTHHRGETRCSCVFYSELPQERAEPPAGGAVPLVHRDLESL